jgi:hypothetical protein
MLAGKLEKLKNLFGKEKTVGAIIIEVRGVTTVPTTLAIDNKPLNAPCALLIITSEEVIKDVKRESGPGYPLPPPKSLPKPGDKLYNSRIMLDCFWSISRDEELIKIIKDLLGKLDDAFKPREVFAKIIYTDGSVEFVSL